MARCEVCGVAWKEDGTVKEKSVGYTVDHDHCYCEKCANDNGLMWNDPWYVRNPNAPVNVKAVCTSCKGTGLYAGFAEKDGAAVVCSSCKGTGCVEIHYTPFVKRNSIPPDIERVFERGFGVCIGKGNGHKLEDFGGMPVEDWKNSKPFHLGSEPRQYVCPFLWTYQDFKASKCDKHCGIGRDITKCGNQPNRAECWAEYDEWKKKNEPKAN